MSFKDLSNDERKNLQMIFSDLKKIFEKDDILAADIDGFIQKLESPEVKSYVTILKNGGKAEAALREAFFAGQSLLSRYLASEMMPEINTGDGFLDYKIFSGNRFVMMELKPLFEAETRESNHGRELVKLKQKKLNWATYESQILKYIKKGGEFIVITDLKDWYFFDDTVTKHNCKPFLQTDFHTLEKDFAMVENFYGLIERYAFTSLREELDKVFFEDLTTWVKMLVEVNFNIDEKKKIEIVLGIINKFIFIQTLDDHSIIDFRWIQKTWEYAEQRWGSRSKFEVLRQFFDDTIKWFFNYYDTELFLKNEVDFLKNEKENVDRFYDTIKLVLGLSYLASDIGGQRGIMQYKFRFIDEDIFGKAYETFLGEIRHDEGVYYTPKYITQYVVENTVGKIFDSKVSEIKKNLESEDFTSAAKNILELTKIKVLDPACGSGSFLIKAVREIWKRYSQLSTILDQLLKGYDVFETLTRDKKIDEKVSNIKHLRDLLGFKSNRELISRLLLRHIYGNDLDPRAVAVAKVNIWLAAVKLSPRDFRYDKLPPDTNRILPYLEINLVNGNAVVGLPDIDVMNYLIKNHKEDISRLTKLRQAYLDNPCDPNIVKNVEEQKANLRKGLMEEFAKYLEKKGISKNVSDITIPLFWPLELWYLYFEDSQLLEEKDRGADCIVGNPPYERIQVLKKKSPDYVSFLDNADFQSSTKNYDLAVIFIERGYKLLKKEGEFGYIVTNKFIQGDYGLGIRSLLSQEKALKEMVDFGDQQIFEDATTYTSLVFLKKTFLQTDKYCLVKKLAKSQDQMKTIADHTSLESADLTIFEYENNKLTGEPWVFLSSKDGTIVQKTEKLPPLSKVSEQIFVGLQTSADPVYIVEGFEKDGGLEITSKINDKKYLVEKKLFREILAGRDIKRWQINWRGMWLFFPYRISGDSVELIKEEEMKSKFPKTWQYLIEHKGYLDKREKGTWTNKENWHAYVYEKNLDMFSKPKILTGVLASKSSFTIDSEGKFYFVGGGNAGGYGISLNQEYKLSLEYVTALLNSSFLDWLVRKKTSRFHGGFFSYAKRFIEDLPIKIPSSKDDLDIKDKIEKYVNSIFSKKKDVKLLESLWSKWSEQLKDADRTFLKILESEEGNIKEGDKDHLWFGDVSFLISKGGPILDEKYEDFKIVTDSKKFSLEIVGVNEESEKSLFRMVCNNLSIASHFFLCIKKSLDSRSKIESLLDLFEKTNVPVLQPSPNQKTPKIIDKVKEEFLKIQNSSDQSVDILELENEIQDLEAKIDGLVFKLYDIGTEEMNSILNSLSLPESYQLKVNS